MRKYIWRSFRGVGGTDSNRIGAKIWRFESVGLSRVHVELNLEVEDDTAGPAVIIGREIKRKRKRNKRVSCAAA
jgi:hypothetical protein